MKFELTISGLCVIALKRQNAADKDKPVNPAAIDIIVPDAHGHKCRLSYLPADVIPDQLNPIEPELAIDHTGERIASFDMNGQALTLSFGTNQATDFNVHWGPDAQQPATPWEETWLNWIPTLEDLGFGEFAIGAPGTLPKGASARLSLPAGALASRKVVTTKDTNEFIVWDFPATKVQRVLTNEVAYTADHVEDLIITDAAGKTRLTGDAGNNGTLRMCISNDMSIVPKDFLAGSDVLEHLSHLDVLAPATKQFAVPSVVAKPQRTGHPICMGVVTVWGP